MRPWRHLRGLVRFARGKGKAHHQRLLERLLFVLMFTAVVYVVGTVLMYFLERHGDNTEIHSLGDAAFFTAVQLLTVSSQLRNPVTAAGRVVDVVLEAYALVVVTTVAGMFAAFFHHADLDESRTESTTP